MARKVITVDGLAGSGKTSLARHLSIKLGYLHLNTGLLYRAVAYVGLQNNCSVSSPDEVLTHLKSQKLDLVFDDAKANILLNGVNITDKLQDTSVSERTSQYAAFEEVRSALYQAQREAFPGCNIVAEGRDMGTVVFTDADIKFFIEAQQSIRIERRLLQLGLDPQAIDNSLKLQVQKEIIERDARDQSRNIAPTIAAKEAIVIDNSSLPLTEMVENMYKLVQTKGLI